MGQSVTSHLLRLWVIGSYEMPRCDWLQHCNFLAGIEILPIALQTACKPCGFAAGRPAIVAGPVLRVAVAESCNVCRALKTTVVDAGTTSCQIFFLLFFGCFFFVSESRNSHQIV